MIITKFPNGEVMDLGERIELRAKLEAQRIKRVSAERAALMPPPSTRRGDVDRVRDIRIIHRIVEGRDDREAFLRFTRATRDQKNE